MRSAKDEELKQLELATATIIRICPASQRVAGAHSIAEVKDPQMEATEETMHPYRGISVRWAILWMLSEVHRVPLTRTDIADRLVAGGVQTSGKDFMGNVSAVLSQMAAKGEVSQQTGEGWAITEGGQNAWDGIKLSAKFRQQQIEAA